MYFTLILAFGLGMGVGVYAQKSGWFAQTAGSKKNPFLDEADSEEADELRAEGAQSVQDRIERRKVKIMAQAKSAGRITNDGVEDLFCVSDATAGNYLQQLVADKQLQKVGTTGRGVYYEPM